jgi:hypothetical protein
MKQQQRKYDQIVSSVRRFTNVFEAFGGGATSEQIKQSIIDLLQPYFANRDQLERLAINALAPEAAEYARLSQDIWAHSLFRYCLQVHWDAKAKDETQCLQTCMEWMPRIYDGLSVFWSLFHSSQDLSEAAINDLLYECLRNIGDLSEAAIKPASSALYSQLLIAQGKGHKTSHVQNLSFGHVINGLLDSCPNRSFFAPWEVPLNQWRNIAQHFSARLEGKDIALWYGPPSKNTTIRLRPGELVSVLARIRDVFACLRLANELFAVDNLPRLIDLGFNAHSLATRPEMYINSLVTGLAAQGFEVMDYKFTKVRSALIIRDRSNLHPDSRRHHTAQFAAALWSYTGAELVSVEYLDQEGKPDMRASADSRLFERAQLENWSEEDIAGEITLTDLRTGKDIPKRPKSSTPE